MKTVCVLKEAIIMSQDGDASRTMTRNAAQYPGAVVQVLSDADYTALSQAACNAAAAALPYDQKRRIEYDRRGATHEALTVALWEKNAVEIARLEAIRQAVKAAIPKPAGV